MAAVSITVPLASRSSGRARTASIWGCGWKASSVFAVAPAVIGTVAPTSAVTRRRCEDSAFAM